MTMKFKAADSETSSSALSKTLASRLDGFGSPDQPGLLEDHPRLAALGIKSWRTPPAEVSNDVGGQRDAVIILMLWLYIAGFVILVGSEIYALLEHHSPDGKRKGEKKQPDR